MSKTRKRVLSVLTILFAVALVFTACFALAGCGDSEETGTTWPADWTEYKFDATKGDATEDKDGNAYYYWIFSDGTSMFGTQTNYEQLLEGNGTGGSTGYWGYENDTLKFVKTSADFDMTTYELTYTNAYCTTTTSGNSVTVTTQDETTWSATIDDIGCLAGKTGYNLSTIEIS